MSAAVAEPLPASGQAPSALEGSYAGWTGVAAWVASVFGHVILILILFLTPWITSLAELDVDLPLARATPTEKLRPNGSSTGVQSNSITSASRVTLDAAVNSVRVDPRPFSGLEGAAGAGSEANPTRGLNIIGIGTGGSDRDRFGVGLGTGGSGPTFFGVGGGGGDGSGGDDGRPARKIVYVVDRSGSMITTFHIVREELIRSISDLRRIHQFHVIFFNADEPIENPPKRLVSASEAQKRAAFEFLETVHPEGGTDPRSAMKRAFEVRPDIIYLLTDGVIPEGGALLEALQSWNHEHRTRIHTVAFLAREGQELLERIAREHNGEFRHITEDEYFRSPGKP